MVFLKVLPKTSSQFAPYKYPAGTPYVSNPEPARRKLTEEEDTALRQALSKIHLKSNDIRWEFVSLQPVKGVDEKFEKKFPPRVNMLNLTAAELANSLEPIFKVLLEISIDGRAIDSKSSKTLGELGLKRGCTVRIVLFEFK